MAGSWRLEALTESRFCGVMLGVAVGDALGARFEGVGSVDPDELAKFASDPGPLRYTDDTHMTLGLARSLVERQGFDAPYTAELFARNFEQEPWRGYGSGPPRVFGLMRQGVPWDQAARSLFDGTGSYGNGGAMRVAPVALFAFRDLDRVARLAQQSAVLTHTHECGVDGAVLQACAVALLLEAEPGRPLYAPALLQQLARHVQTKLFREILESMESLPADLPPPEAALRLGNGIETFRSVPTALYAFLRHPDSFAGAVLYAIRVGGDTDTIASMTGALAGAYLGEEVIPAGWRERVEDAAELRRLARALFLLCEQPARSA